MEINGNQRKSMKTNGNQWKPMEINENQWKSMKIHRRRRPPGVARTSPDDQTQSLTSPQCPRNMSDPSRGPGGRLEWPQVSPTKKTYVSLPKITIKKNKTISNFRILIWDFFRSESNHQEPTGNQHRPSVSADKKLKTFCTFFSYQIFPKCVTTYLWEREIQCLLVKFADQCRL